MSVRDKMLRAYFCVAEHLKSDPAMVSTEKAFYRTKKVAFFVKAYRLDEDGLMAGEEKQYQTKHTISKY